MNISIDRKWAKAEYTVGRMYVDGEMFCHTLEPPLTGNSSHPKGAIPRGVYGVSITWSPRFKRMLPLVNGVPGFSGIRIHSGNTVSDTMGCILVGTNTSVGRLTSSRATLEKLIWLINDARERKEYNIINKIKKKHYGKENNLLRAYKAGTPYPYGGRVRCRDYDNG